MSQRAHKTCAARQATAARSPPDDRAPPRTCTSSHITRRTGWDAPTYARRSSATPMQLVQMERIGVVGSLIKDLSKRMEIPSTRIFRIIGVPKATAEKKASAKEMVAGRGGQAAIGMVRLLGIARRRSSATAPRPKRRALTQRVAWPMDRAPSARAWRAQARRPAQDRHRRRNCREATRLDPERRLSVKLCADCRGNPQVAPAPSAGGRPANPGRWNDDKEPVVYCAPTIAIAVLETAAHVDDAGLPLDVRPGRDRCSGRLVGAAEEAYTAKLPATWSAIPAGRASVKIGSEWLSSSDR